MFTNPINALDQRKKIPFGDLSRQYQNLKAEIDEAVARVMSSGWYILGPELERFEKNFGAYYEGHFCVGVGSGTDALQIALMDAGVGVGDEVITVANTAVPTVSAISAVGADPVFVDIESDTFLMDMNKVQGCITKKTKAIIPVHLYGQSVDMDPLLATAKKHNLTVIEDCAQAHGATYKNKKVGTMGDYGCFSFYPSKNLGAAGDAGAILVKMDAQVNELKMFRNYGQEKRYYNSVQGINSRLDEIQAAILNVKLSYTDQWTERRRFLSKMYYDRLKESSLQLPMQKENCTHVYHLFVVRSDSRDDLLKHLQNNDITALMHYPLLIPEQKAYVTCKSQMKYLPVSKKASGEILSLPLFPELTEEELNFICDVVLNQ